MCQRGTHGLRATNPRTHKHTHANANTHTWRATRRTHCKRHGLRRSRPSPVIAEGATLVAALVAALVEDEAAEARVHARPMVLLTIRSENWAETSFGARWYLCLNNWCQRCGRG